MSKSMQQNCVYCGIDTVQVNYRGIRIIRNPFGGSWAVFYQNHESPFMGTLREMKKVIDREISLNGAVGLVHTDRA